MRLHRVAAPPYFEGVLSEPSEVRQDGIELRRHRLPSGVEDFDKLAGDEDLDRSQFHVWEAVENQQGPVLPLVEGDRDLLQHPIGLRLPVDDLEGGRRTLRPRGGLILIGMVPSRPASGWGEDNGLGGRLHHRRGGVEGFVEQTGVVPHDGHLARPRDGVVVLEQGQAPVRLAELLLEPSKSGRVHGRGQAEGNVRRPEHPLNDAVHFLVESPGGKVSGPIVVVPVVVGEKVSADGGKEVSILLSFTRRDLRESPATSLAQLAKEFAEGSELGANVPLLLGVHIVEELDVVVVLFLPLFHHVEAEVVTEDSQDDVALEDLRMAPVLVVQRRRPATRVRSPPRHSRFNGSMRVTRPRPIEATMETKLSPLGDVLVGDLDRSHGRTRVLEESAKVELAANLRMRPARVDHVVVGEAECVHKDFVLAGSV
jgi:hypothetical protein